jgi:hypothetical protein
MATKSDGTRTAYAFLGGVNNSISDELIGQDECSDARNFMPDYTGQGAVIKREGIALSSTTSALTTWPTTIYGGLHHVYATAGVAGPSDHGGGAWGIYTETGVLLLDGAAEDWGIGGSWATFLGYDIFATPLQCFKISGSTVTSFSGYVAGAQYLATANNFLYFAPGSGLGTLGWYDLGTINYSAVNELIITKDQNDKIVGLHPYGNGVLVFCQKSFCLVTASSNLEQGISYSNKAEGCVSHASIVTTPVGVFWWSKSGLTWMKSDMSLDYPTARKIPHTIFSLLSVGSTTAHGIHDPLQRKVSYYQLLASSFIGDNPLVWLRVDYYYDTDKVYLHDGAGVQAYSSGTNMDGYNDWSCYIGLADKNVYRITSVANTDSGTSISAYAESRRETDPDILKDCRKVVVTTGLTTNATVSYGCYVDNDTSVDTSWNITPGTGVVDTTIGVNRANRKLKHRIADASAYRGRFISVRPVGRDIRSI